MERSQTKIRQSPKGKPAQGEVRGLIYTLSNEELQELESMPLLVKTTNSQVKEI
jgi:hypothetical protein